MCDHSSDPGSLRLERSAVPPTITTRFGLNLATICGNASRHSVQPLRSSCSTPRYSMGVFSPIPQPTPGLGTTFTPLVAAHDSRPADSTQLCESPTRSTRAGNAGSTAESDGASSGTAGSSEMICCCNARADSSRLDKRSPASARRSRPPITTATPTSAITANHTYSRRPTHRTRRRTGSSMSR